MFNILSLVIAALAVYFSYNATKKVKEANITADKALKVSSSQFSSLNDPVLFVLPLKIESEDSYFFIKEIDSSSAKIQFNFKVKNTGNLGAKSIFFKDITCLAHLNSEWVGGCKLANDSIPGPNLSWIDIPAKEELVRSLIVHLQMNEIKNIEYFISKFFESGFFELNFSIQYKSQHSGEIKYTHIYLSIGKKYYKYNGLKFG